MYQLIRGSDSIRRLADMACIPRDARNVDYQAFLAWQAAGNTVLPADPAPPPTQEDLDRLAANAYAKLTALRGMTPAQVAAWVDANATTVAQHTDAIKTLAIGVSILARQLNGGT